MADALNETIADVAQNSTTKASSEGMVVAYSSLVIMALVPIFFGSFRSVKYLKKQKESGEKPEVVSQRYAAMFPFIASGALLGLYIFFKLFSKEYINLLLTVYFFGLGVIALTSLVSPVMSKFLPDQLNVEHHIVHTMTEKDVTDEIINFKFTNKDLVSFVFCSAVGATYLWKKHWIMNNVFGLAFALNGVEILHINSVTIGCTLLAGLFIYDIFWVFGTDVMVTVAKSFEAPIKLVFPQDIFENSLEGKNFAMLGLGDIVIPGMFIALLLRFDKSLQRKHNIYFITSFFAYFLALVLTICVMSYFKHAQPALLYLVPACIGTPLLVACIKGDINALFKYADHPEEENEGEGGEAEKVSDSTKSEKQEGKPEAKKVK